MTHAHPPTHDTPHTDSPSNPPTPLQQLVCSSNQHTPHISFGTPTGTNGTTSYGNITMSSPSLVLLRGSTTWFSSYFYFGCLESRVVHHTHFVHRAIITWTCLSIVFGDHSLGYTLRRWLSFIPWRRPQLILLADRCFDLFDYQQRIRHHQLHILSHRHGTIHF